MHVLLALVYALAVVSGSPVGRDGLENAAPPRDELIQLGSDPLGTGIGLLPARLLEAAQLRRRGRQLPPAKDGHGVNADIFCGPSDGSTHPQPANPFIGSGGEGFGVGTLNPGASVPFGLVRAGPDTCDKAGVRIQWEQCAGYSSCDDHIRAFSHTHTVGAGVMDYGNVGIMPTVGFTPAKTACTQPVKSSDYFRACPFRSRFSHSTEIAYPGFYSTVLYDDATSATINVSLTATDHAAVHTYSWAAPSLHRRDRRAGRRTALDEDRVVIVDLCHMVGMAKTIQDSCPNATVAIDYEAGEVSGWMHAIGDYSKRFNGFIIHFVMRFNTSFDPASSGTWQNGTAYPGGTSLSGVEVGAYLNFGSIASSSEAVEVAVGISFIDGEHARLNLEEEVGAMGFQQTLDAATARWQQALGLIEVTGGSASDRSKFYTALFHAFLAPTNFTEAGGDYLGFDGAVHSDVENFFSDMSIWDIYRSQFPLLTLVQPRVATNVMQSMLAMNRQQGRLPKWAMGPADANGMNGLHSVAMLTDGALARMPEAADLNLTEALMAAVNSLNKVEPSDYRTKGYVVNSPCDTLEYSVDDHCTARLAELAGYPDIQEQFNQSSQNWRNVFDPETQFMCAKDDNGSWVQCRSPLWPLLALNVFSEYYVEGDAWHYRWNVPQDFPSLIAAFPSVDEFVSQLDFFFNQSSRSAYDFLPNMYYWAGNEPSILSAYGFVHAGRPDLMHKYTREMMGLRYTTTTSGLPGNDDYGTMSAWFVWNAMGLYPQPCQGTFAITSPLFDSVVIHRAEGDIKIVVANNSPTNVYVSEVTVNGQPLPPSEWLLDQNLLRKGGATIEMTMSATPPRL